MSTISELYKRAIHIDNAFSAELERVFGSQACNARYDERGRSTPSLLDLANAKVEADAALHNAFAARRGDLLQSL
jgi:hypothetical protein